MNSNIRISFAVTLLAFVLGSPHAQAPSNLAYTPDSLMYSDAGPSEAVPTVTGAVTRWTVDPSLPEGLLLDSVTGRISGWPMSLFPWTAYNIVAMNAVGSDTTVLHIASAGGLSVHSAAMSRIRFDFNDRGTVSFTLPAAAQVTITAYTTTGTRIKTLLHEQLRAGMHARKVDVSTLPPGAYIVRLQTEAGTEIGMDSRMFIKRSGSAPVSSP